MPTPPRQRRPAAHVVLLVIAAGLLAIDPAPASPASPGPAAAPGQPLAGDDCRRCHAFETTFSHPVGVVPSMPIPAHLPLENGRIGCVTCHDVVPGPDHEAEGRRVTSPVVRGVSEGPAFCLECHDPIRADATALHAGFVARAHVEPFPGPEADSEGCLACHDGSVASDAGPFGGPMTSLRRFTEGHPIDVEYDVTGRAFVPAASLDHRIRLFDGRVECGSCHSIYAPGRMMLVVPNDGSRLCLGCHDV